MCVWWEKRRTWDSWRQFSPNGATKNDPARSIRTFLVHDIVDPAFNRLFFFTMMIQHQILLTLPYPPWLSDELSYERSPVAIGARGVAVTRPSAHHVRRTKDLLEGGAGQIILLGQDLLESFWIFLLGSVERRVEEPARNSNNKPTVKFPSTSATQSLQD